MADPESVTLGEVAADSPDSFVDGPFGSNLKSTEYTASGVRLIQLQNIGDGSWNDENKKFISARKFEGLSRHGARAGDIAIAKMAHPVARSCVLPPVAEQFVVVADSIKLVPDPGRYDVRFVNYAINSRRTRHEAESKSTGTTRLRINLTVLKTVSIWAPRLFEQRRIADILDTMDEAINKTEQIIAKLRQMKQGLVHDLLTRGIDENGELRDPERYPKQFKSSPIGGIPCAWGFTDVERIGFVVAGGTPRRDVPAFWGGDIPWLTPGELTSFDGLVVERTMDQISQAGLASSGAVLVQTNTVLVTTRATLGLAALAGRQMATNQGFKNIVLNNDQDPTFWCYKMRSMAQLMERFASGTTFLEVSGSQFKRLPVAVPPRSEQVEIASRLYAMDEGLSRHRQACRKLVALRQGLVDDVLTGRVRTRDPAETHA